MSSPGERKSFPSRVAEESVEIITNPKTQFLMLSGTYIKERYHNDVTLPGWTPVHSSGVAMLWSPITKGTPSPWSRLSSLSSLNLIMNTIYSFADASLHTISHEFNPSEISRGLVIKWTPDDHERGWSPPHALLFTKKRCNFYRTIGRTTRS
ncbi:hypothetical protein AVEN_48964-1 [Araneus ventricosus]|uniref:Uncharacterized protein n=1 Tax=Araneus ventricosus TaxID=182803 RepID=A0A4Y2AIC4_ARAVE|nr:hypothetical protein AVEN_48964-1 [Araneus ventricosus]